MPFTFEIPYHAKETDRTNMDNAILWYVDAAASVPGVDYGAQFEVPLFRTSESDPDFEPAREAEVPDQMAEDLTQYRQPRGHHGEARPARWNRSLLRPGAKCEEWHCS